MQDIVSEEAQKYKIWSENYKQTLEILQNDLVLILSHGFKLIGAIDFHDIFDYCFPFAAILRKGRGTLWSDETTKDIYI